MDLTNRDKRTFPIVAKTTGVLSALPLLYSIAGVSRRAVGSIRRKETYETMM